MSTVLFIRHAETDMAGSFCGHSDPQVNAKGRAQIAQLLRQISEMPIRAVFSSDLVRARSTAEAIAAAAEIPFHLSSALREIDFGEWEGLTWKQVEQRDPRYAAEWLRRYPELPAPGGEAFSSFEQRVLQEIHRIFSTEGPTEGDHFAVVTHAGVLRIILGRLCSCSEEDAWRQTSSYCSWFRFEVLF